LVRPNTTIFLSFLLHLSFFLSCLHRFGYPTLIPENPFLYSSPPAPLTDLENTPDLFRDNTAPIFGLRREQSGNYVTLSFEDSLQDSKDRVASDIIFVINHIPRSQNPDPATTHSASSAPADFTYFALKGVGVEAPNGTGRVVRLILSSPSAHSGPSLSFSLLLSCLLFYL
jgi:hypothetical protein